MIGQFGVTQTTRRSLLIGAFAIAVAGLAACSGSSDSSSASSAAMTAPAATATGPDVASSSVASATTPARLNLNTATADQFKTVPGVGDRFVREFMEYRPYTTILQFRRELGKYVSQDQVREWEKYLYVPVDPNQADADTLQQLPGVNATIAQQLIAGRPYDSTDAFLAKLGQLVSADQATAARGYVAGS